MSESISLHPQESLQKKFVLSPISTEAWNPDEYPRSVVAALGTLMSERYFMNNDDGSTTFVGLHASNGANGLFGKVIDEKDRQILGETTFGYFGTEYPPRIISTFTNAELYRNGLAKRRAMIIDQICMERCGIHLHSSTVRSPLAEGFWKHLVAQQLAKETVDLHGKKVYSLM